MTLLALAVTFLAGVVVADRLDIPVSALGMFALAFVLVAALQVSVRRTPLPAFLLLLLILGALRVELNGDDPASALVAYHSRRPLQVQGVVVGDPDAAGAATRFRLAVDRIRPEDDWIKASGEVLVTLREPAELVRTRERPYIRYGDTLLLEGVLQAPPTLEEFDYPAYLARQGIGSVMSFPQATLLDVGGGNPFYRWLYSTRRAVADSLAEVVPEPQASLGQALLLGMREHLPPDLVEKFRTTGTSHLLAISGLHVGILLGLSLGASAWALGRRRHLYLMAPLVLMWLYALVAGMSPSVARAAIMGSVYLAALALGRPRSVLPALGLAATVMVAIAPDVLWSVSFQLSFAAMAGIAVFTDPVVSWLQARLGARPDAPRASVSQFIALTVAMTIAATVATLPLVAFYFERVSLVGIPTTALSLPAMPLVLVTQAVAGLVGLVSTTVALPFGWLAWLATAYLTAMVGLFARLPAASVETGRIAPLLVWAYYGLLVLWFGRSRLKPLAAGTVDRLRESTSGLPLTGRTVPWWVLLPAVSVAALLWTAALSMPDGRLHVAFADVGQGDAVLITTPGGQHVMVDGGPDPLEAARLLGGRLPFWDRSVDLVVLTHPHRDHVAGLTEVLRRYDVAYVLERRFPHDSPEYQAWRRAVEDEGAVVIQAQPGQVVTIDDGVFIQVLGPPETLMRGTDSDVDNASVVLRLVYRDVSFLLTGDMFHEAESALLAQDAPIDSDVLKVAHHGSRSSSIAAFLESVSPAVAVISAEEDNRFGHPHAETVEALLKHVAEDALLLTSERGTIEFVTDGRRLEVITER